jgi:hypothetical protein
MKQGHLGTKDNPVCAKAAPRPRQGRTAKTAGGRIRNSSEDVKRRIMVEKQSYQQILEWLAGQGYIYTYRTLT